MKPGLYANINAKRKRWLKRSTNSRGVHQVKKNRQGHGKNQEMIRKMETTR